PTTSFPSYIYRRPQVLTSSFTSTLTPTIVNEVRYGMRRTGINSPAPFDNPNGTIAKDAHAFFPEINGIPVVPQLGGTAIGFLGGQPYGSIGHGGGETNGSLFPATLHESTPLYTYADTLSWTKGVHSFRGGAEVRFASSTLIDQGTANAWNTHGRAFGGETPLTPVQGINTTNMPGLGGTATAGNQFA